MVTWEDPQPDSERVPTREEIGEALRSRPGKWAVVARPDRIARAESLVKRIVEGREYGSGFTAHISKIGPEHRVYARFNG